MNRHRERRQYLRATCEDPENPRDFGAAMLRFTFLLLAPSYKALV